MEIRESKLEKLDSFHHSHNVPSLWVIPFLQEAATHMRRLVFHLGTDFNEIL